MILSSTLQDGFSSFRGTRCTLIPALWKCRALATLSNLYGALLIKISNSKLPPMFSSIMENLSFLSRLARRIAIDTGNGSRNAHQLFGVCLYGTGRTYRMGAPIIILICALLIIELIRSLKLHSRYPSLLDALEPALDNPPAPEVLRANSALEQALEVARTCTLSGGPRARATSVLEESLRRSILNYGEAARDAFNGVLRKDRVDQDINLSLDGLTIDALIDAIEHMLKHDAASYQMTGPHKLMSLVVHHASSLDSDDHFVPKFKSEPIGQRVLKKHAHLEHKEAVRLFNVFRSSPQSGITAGWIFEGLVHGVLCCKLPSNALRGPLVAMRAKKSGTAPAPAPRFVTVQDFDSGAQHLPIRPRSHTVVDFSQATFAPPPHRNIEDLFYVPNAFNNPLFDSFFVELRTGPLTAVVWIFQVTTAKDHEGSPQGYPLIDAIKAVAPAHAQVELNYVLVCPEPKRQVSWKMPEGWLSRRGNVFCQFVDFSVSSHRIYCPSELIIIIIIIRPYPTD